MKKLSLLFLILSILFMILTFAGAAYVLLSHGGKNPGYAAVPMLFAMVFMNLHRICKKEK